MVFVALVWCMDTAAGARNTDVTFVVVFHTTPSNQSKRWCVLTASRVHDHSLANKKARQYI